MVVGRLHALNAREGPQRRIDGQDVSAETLHGRIVARLTCVQRGAELILHRDERRLQHRPSDAFLAKISPQREESSPCFQTGLTDLEARLAAPIGPFLEISFQMRPADLTKTQGHLVVDRQAITAHHALNRITQQFSQLRLAPTDANFEAGNGLRGRHP